MQPMQGNGGIFEEVQQIVLNVSHRHGRSIVSASRIYALSSWPSPLVPYASVPPSVRYRTLCVRPRTWAHCRGIVSMPPPLRSSYDFVPSLGDIAAAWPCLPWCPEPLRSCV